MSKEETSRLTNVRPAYKGHCTRDAKKAERLMSASEDIDVAELTALSERLNRRMGEIAGMDTKIQALTIDSEELEREIEGNLLFQDEMSVWHHRITMATGAANKTPVRQFHSDSKN